MTCRAFSLVSETQMIHTYTHQNNQVNKSELHELHTCIIFCKIAKINTKTHAHANATLHTHKENKRAFPAIYHKITHLCSSRILDIRGYC